MIFSYDSESDIMYFSIGQPKEGVDSEIQDGIYVRKDTGGKVIGFMIMDFKKRFEKDSDYSIPIGFDNIRVLSASK